MVTGAQLDEIKDAQDTAAWHELNREDHAAKVAVELLGKAVKALEQVEKLLQDAEANVADTPEADRIGSLNMAAEEFEISLRVQAERMKQL